MGADKVGEETPHSGNGLGGQPGSTENVERIREILFGPQIREFGQQLSRVEERLSQEAADLKAETRRRLDAIEVYTRQEMADLGERLRTERGERAESCSQLSQALADSTKTSERRLTESDERTAKGLRELRQATFERIKSILDDLDEQINSLKAFQKLHLEELRDRSIDRFEFSDLLTGLALRLRRDSVVSRLGECDGAPKP
jgi:hypothetical protein